MEKHSVQIGIPLLTLETGQSISDNVPDDSRELNARLSAMSNGGGMLKLKTGTYNLVRTLELNSPCLGLAGEIWSYSADPNGVFESCGGTKLRLSGQDHPALRVGGTHTAEGFVLENFGIQGDIKGMDTRHMWNPDNPSASAGLCFDGTRLDQGKAQKLSFCGLGAAICALPEAELDACRLEALNLDGCAVGIHFAPRASYYTRITDCVCADNPYYGLWIDGSPYTRNGEVKKRNIYNLEISGNHFVRNGGAFEEGPKSWGLLPAAVYLKNISDSLFRNNLIDYAGLFWYYPPNAVKNDECRPRQRRTPSLVIEGDRNRITGNTFAHSKDSSDIIRGNENVLFGNFSDGDVVIDGEGNVVSELILTSDRARLILSAGKKNWVRGVPEEKILYLKEL